MTNFTSGAQLAQIAVSQIPRFWTTSIHSHLASADNLHGDVLQDERQVRSVSEVDGGEEDLAIHWEHFILSNINININIKHNISYQVFQADQANLQVDGVGEGVAPPENDFPLRHCVLSRSDTSRGSWYLGQDGIVSQSFQGVDSCPEL